MEFLEGWGVQATKPSVGGVRIFSGTTHCNCKLVKVGWSLYPLFQFLHIGSSFKLPHLSTCWGLLPVC